MPENKTRRQLTGKVIKLSTPDTIKVRVEIKQQHPLYKKVVTSHKNYLAHADSTQVTLGSVVIIEEVKPFSKMKKWILVSNISQTETKQTSKKTAK